MNTIDSLLDALPDSYVTSFALVAMLVMAVLLPTVIGVTVWLRTANTRREKRTALLSPILSGLVERVAAGMATDVEIRQALPPRDFDTFAAYLTNEVGLKARVDVSAERTIADISGFSDAMQRKAARTRGVGRARILRVLSHLRDASNAPFFRSYLSDRDRLVRYAAALGLATADSIDDIPLIVDRVFNEDEPNRDLLMTVLGVFGAAAAPHMTELLDDGHLHPEQKTVLVDLLGRLKYRPALEAVRTCVRAPERTLRVHALDALGAVGDVSDCDRVRPQLEDEDFRVRLKAVNALERLGGGAVLPEIDAMLDDEDSWVRRNAAEALIRMKAPGVARLREIARSDREQARIAAKLVLAEQEFNRLRWGVRHADAAA